MDVVSLYSTWPDLPSAEAAAHDLVERRLIACANIIPGARSVFRWEGQVQAEAEVVMLAKTTAAKSAAASAALVELHPYDLPCVVEIAIGAPGSNSEFLAWVAAQVT